MNIQQDVARKLLNRAWEDGALADSDTADALIQAILNEGKQYFTAEEIIELLTQNF